LVPGCRWDSGEGPSARSGKVCPRHTDWFFFFLLRVFVVRGVFFFALFLLAFFLFFKFFFGSGVVAHAVLGDGAVIDDDALEMAGAQASSGGG